MLARRGKKLSALSLQTSVFCDTSCTPCREDTWSRVVQWVVSNPRPEISCFFQNGFSRISQQIVGKAVHGVFVKEEGLLRVFHMNTLIKMYLDMGNLKYATQVFEGMPERNGASWNNMISGYVRIGLCFDALRLFIDMWRGGFELNGYNIPSILTSIARSGTRLVEGLQIHSLVVKNGLEWDVFVGTSLLHFYGAYRLISDARFIFQEMPVRNVVSWTSLMVNYSDCGLFSEVLNLYREMRLEGVICNQNTFTTLISSCGALDDESLVHQVLGHVIKSGLEHNVSVSNSIISTFGDFGDVETAGHVFNHMHSYDTISWNSMLDVCANSQLFEETLEYFHLMRHNHDEIDETTVSSVVSVFDSLEKLKWGRGVHCLVLKMGFDLDICVSNTLLSMYFDTGSHEDADKYFDNMPQKDLITWNSMIAGYVAVGRPLDSLRVFKELLTMENIMNFVTFTSSLSACADAELSSKGMAIHGQVITCGFNENMVVNNALVTMYSKCGMTEEAEKIFHSIPQKELVAWNSLIGCYAENKEVGDVIKAYNLMRRSCVSPNHITLVSMLGACSDPNNLVRHGMPLHAHIMLIGFESDAYVKNSLISMYANCADLDSSMLIFSQFLDKTSATWNAMVAGKAHNGRWEEALELVQEMNRTELNLDQFSLSAALSSMANLAILEGGQHFHAFAVKRGFDNYHFVENAMMDMYGKCGELSDLLELLPEPKKRTRLSWNISISAFSRHGDFEKAQEIFRAMVLHGARPDHVTFVSLLSACSHAGLVDEGLEYFASMTKVFGVPAGIEHCVCVVDLLSRSGRLAEAEAFITEMPVPPNDFIWRTLLAGCKVHGDIELSRRATENLLKANPSDDSAYVLYSNICATSGRWQDVFGLRKMMESDKVRKKPAFSWLNIKNNMNTFGAGDKSHKDWDKIQMKLMELKVRIKEAGYIANTSYALQDTDEEQKEDHLWDHSERIALAYGLIGTKEGATLRIFKNLRVCGDCHSVYKFVSSLSTREIVLRDPYRFHHFRGGKCSCNDYW